MSEDADDTNITADPAAVTLTPQEQAMLADACYGDGEYPCCHRATHRRTGRPVGGSMLDAVEQIIAARLAATTEPQTEKGQKP